MARIWEDVHAGIERLHDRLDKDTGRLRAELAPMVSEALEKALAEKMPEIEAAMQRIAEKVAADLQKALVVSARTRKPSGK